jgi:hypothetical protein
VRADCRSGCGVGERPLFLRTGDGDDCPAILGQLEEHRQVIASLQIDRTCQLLQVRRSDDFAPTPSAARGGSVRAELDRALAGRLRSHELIHAYWRVWTAALAADGGRSGGAVCQRTPRPSGSWRDLLRASFIDGAIRRRRLAGRYMLRMFRATD